MLNDNQEFCANCGVKAGEAAAEDSARTAEESSCPALTFARSAALP